MKTLNLDEMKKIKGGACGPGRSCAGGRCGIWLYNEALDEWWHYTAPWWDEC